MKQARFSSLTFMLLLCGATLCAAASGSAEVATSAAVYQCYQGAPSASNRNSVVVAVDKTGKVNTVAASKEDSELPAYARPMVKTGGDFDLLFNPIKPVSDGYAVSRDGAKRAQLKGGELTLNCVPTNEE